MADLSSKQRVLLALDRKETDRVPIDFGGRISGIATSTYDELKKIMGISAVSRTFNRRLQIASVDEEVLELLRVDTRHICLAPAVTWNPQWEEDGSYRDEWGCKLSKPVDSFYYDFVDAPLANATIDDLERYTWPNTKDYSRIKGKKEEARAITRDGGYALFTSFKGTFERSWALRGMQQFFMDMILDRDFAEALLDKVLEVQQKIYGPFFEEISLFLDVVCFTDDIGSQTAPLISPDIYRELIKPLHLKWVNFIKEKTNAKVALHSCGRVVEFLPDFKEIGIEVLNPIQVTATGMEPQTLKEKHGNDFCFWGAVDTQHLLPFASLSEVEKSVKSTVSILSKGGGYILAPAHNIQPMTPPENVLKMFQATFE